MLWILLPVLAIGSFFIFYRSRARFPRNRVRDDDVSGSRVPDSRARRLLRAAVLFLFAIAILAPYREQRRFLPPRLILLCDNSRSMDRPLERPGETPLRDLERFLSKLPDSKNRYRVERHWLFPAEKEPYGGDSRKQNAGGRENARLSRTGSPIGNRIRELLRNSHPDAPPDAHRDWPDDRPAAFVLLSDGIVTEGISLAEAAEYASTRGTPFHAVGFGSERPPGDLRWARGFLPHRAFLGEPFEIQAPLRMIEIPVVKRNDDEGTPEANDSPVIRNASGVLKATVRLEQLPDPIDPVSASRAVSPDAPTAASTVRLLQSKDVVIPSGTGEMRISLLLVPRREGTFRYRIRVDASGEFDEWDKVNNAVDFSLTIDRERLHVLYIEQSPRYEYRFLRELLLREPEIELRTVLFDADSRYTEQDPTAISPNDLTAESIEARHLVILGDVDPETLGPALISSLASTAEKRSLLLISGPRFLPRRYFETPLARMFPKGTYRVQKKEETSEIRFAHDPLIPQQAVGSADDADRNDPPGKGATAPQPHVSQPLVYGALAVESPDPLQRVLASTGSGAALMLLRPNGSGGVYWQGTDQTWRLRAIGEGAFYRRYWLGLVRFLAGGTKRMNSVHTNSAVQGETSDALVDEDPELVRLARDSEALRQAALSCGGVFYPSHDLEVADWFDSLPEGEPVLDEIYRVPLVPPTALLPIAIIFLGTLWYTENR